MVKRRTGKKVWKDFEVIRVKLNPEQAVLSCCTDSASARGWVDWMATWCHKNAGCGAERGNDGNS